MRLFRQLCLEKGSLMVSVLLLCNELKQAASGVFPSKGLRGIWSWTGTAADLQEYTVRKPPLLLSMISTKWDKAGREPCLYRAERGSGLCTPSPAPHTLPDPSAPLGALGASWWHGLGQSWTLSWGHLCGDSLFQCHSAASSWMQFVVTAWNQIASDDLM